MRLNSKSGRSKPRRGRKPNKHLPRRDVHGGGHGDGHTNLYRHVFGWLLELEMVCWDLTISGSLFHSAGVAVAKPHLLIAFSVQIKETVSYFQE